MRCCWLVGLVLALASASGCDDQLPAFADPPPPDAGQAGDAGSGSGVDEDGGGDAED